MKSVYFSKLMYFWYSEPDSGCKEDATFGWSLLVNPALQVRNVFISSPVWCPVSNKFLTSRRICFLRDEILPVSKTYFWKQFYLLSSPLPWLSINKKSHIQQQANAFSTVVVYETLYNEREMRSMLSNYLIHLLLLYFILF